MVNNALELKANILEEASTAEDPAVPVWAKTALATLAENGICMDTQPLTRSQAADVLYQSVRLKARQENRFEE